MRFGFSLLLFFWTAFALFPEDVDSLFEDPVSDIVVPEAPSGGADHLANFQKSDGMVVAGSFKAAGGAALGWTEFPVPADPARYWNPSPLATASTTFSMDARPEPDFRVYGNFGVYMTPSSGSYSWSQVTVNELFCDYTLFDRVFVRLGKHSISWGQGRLYNPGDLMADSKNGTALRLSFPTLFSGLSAIALAQEAFFLNDQEPSYRETAVGALADFVILDTRASLGARYRGSGENPEGLRVLGSLKRTVVGTDLLCDLVYREPPAGERSWTALGGFFKEWERVKLYGEYLYEGDGSGTAEQRFGLAFGLREVFGSKADLGLKWLHAASARSGAVVAALNFNVWKHLTGTLAVPVVYGDSGRYDILNDTNVSTENYTLTQRFSVVALFKLEAPF